MAEECATDLASNRSIRNPPNKQRRHETMHETIDQFHSGRYLIAKNLPRDVTTQEVRAVMEERGFCIREIRVNSFAGTGYIYLNDGSDRFEYWSPDDSSVSVRGHKICLSPSRSDGILCVSHLPLIYSEKDFENLVQMCGPVVKCFLMRTNKSGSSKGYGFVEYANKTAALQARDLVDGKEIGSCKLRCDWLDPNYVTYDHLHSKCLYVDHLPPEFRDVDELRRCFSIVVKPIYCQVVLKNNCPTGIGLVEFESAECAEETQIELNGFTLEKRKIRVTFCMPGIHAMTICNKLINDPNVVTSKRPLLPDPQSPPIHNPLMALQNNAQFFHNIQCSLLASNLQNARKGASMALLATPAPVSNSVNNNNNAQIQAAMMLLLAAQAQQNGQQQQHQNSILGAPHSMGRANDNRPALTNREIVRDSCSRRPLLPDPPTTQLRKGLLPTPDTNRNWERNNNNNWKSPLLGDRPMRNYYQETTTNKQPLLGDRPSHPPPHPPPPSSLSPTSSVSSLASDLTDTSTSTTKDTIDNNNNPLMTLLLQATRHNKGAPSNDGSKKRRSLLGDFPGALQLLLPANCNKRKSYENSDVARPEMMEFKRVRK